MNVSQLASALGDLAEVFGTRPVSDRAVTVWYDALKDLDGQTALDVIYDWPKTGTKFPTPADVRQRVSARISREIERRAAEENARNTETTAQWINRSADPAVKIALKHWFQDLKLKNRGINRDTWWQTRLLARYGRGEATKKIERDMLRKLYHCAPEQIPQKTVMAAVVRDQEQEEYEKSFPTFQQYLAAARRGEIQ